MIYGTEKDKLGHIRKGLFKASQIFNPNRRLKLLKITKGSISIRNGTF
jgi:hypothetical protein